MKKSILSLLLLVNLVNADFIRDDVKEVVIDTSTNLMWQDNAESNSTTKTWALANIYCEDLTLASKTDWRLPNRKQLITIGDKTINTPAIYQEFTYKKSENYWTSSTYKNDASKAWFVGFNYAWSWVEAKTNGSYFVSCVRVVE